VQVIGYLRRRESQLARDDDKSPTYAEVARELGLSTPQVTNHLHAARRRFRELALLNLRALVGTDDEYRAEARELFGLEVQP